MVCHKEEITKDHQRHYYHADEEYPDRLFDMDITVLFTFFTVVFSSSANLHCGNIGYFLSAIRTFTIHRDSSFLLFSNQIKQLCVIHPFV